MLKKLTFVAPNSVINHVKQQIVNYRAVSEMDFWTAFLSSVSLYPTYKDAPNLGTLIKSLALSGHLFLNSLSIFCFILCLFKLICMINRNNTLLSVLELFTSRMRMGISSSFLNSHHILWPWHWVAFVHSDRLTQWRLAV